VIVFAAVGYLKIIGYIVSGFAVAKIWFAKEIAAGKKLLNYVEAKAKSAEIAVVNEAKKL